MQQENSFSFKFLAGIFIAMKYLVFLLLVCNLSHAIQSRKITASAASPIPTTYTTNGQSLILSELPIRDKRIHIISTMPNVACVVNGTSSSTAPTTPTSSGYWREVFVLASEPLTVEAPSRNVYCRSHSGAQITSGELYVFTD